MDVPMSTPTPTYPSNYAFPQTPQSSNTANEATTPSKLRKNSSGISLASLGGNRNQSYLSLASLNLAHSTSSLLGIFSSALDSVPATPQTEDLLPEMQPREPSAHVIEEFDKWTLVRDTIRSVSVLFALGYAFAILLLSLENNHALPFPYFQAMTELKFFPLLCGATTVLMGCLIPTVDYCYDKYIEDQRRRERPKSQDSEGGDSDRRLLWESAEWSMPMRYIGGVIGFAWAASRLNWTSQVQLYAVIALAALALWFLFDRTGLGLCVSLVVGIGSWLGFMLLITPGISHPVVDATGWMPSALFSATVTFGNIGRKLFQGERNRIRRRRYSLQ